MEHPIIPPPKLVQQWDKEAAIAAMPDPIYIARQAARWGADQELEACAEWIYQHFQCGLQWGKDLRAARRPKPPSLKQQALQELEHLTQNLKGDVCFTDAAIRRALESLPDPQD